MLLHEPDIGIRRGLNRTHIVPDAENRRLEDTVRAVFRLLTYQVARLQEEEAQRDDEHGCSQQHEADTELSGESVLDLTHRCPPFPILSVWSE